MSSSPDFMAFIADQLKEAGGISSRKMFGEYGVYKDGKVFAFVCDDQLFVKPTDAGRILLGRPDLAPPYTGASLYFRIDDLDDAESLCELVRATVRELPEPKPKKKKTAK